MSQELDIVDPYAFFGVTPNSTLRELSQAYYQMALICHPDKGGSSESMKYISIAYRWIREQMEHTILQNKSFQDYYGSSIDNEPILNFTDILHSLCGYSQEIFTKACIEVNIQDEKVKKMLYIPIYEKILLNHTTNQLIDIPDQETLYKLVLKELETFKIIHSNYSPEVSIFDYSLTIPHGYGTIIQNNSNDNSYINNCNLYNSTMTIYTEPNCKIDNIVSGCATIPSIKKLDDYTVYTQSISMYDYEEAFKTHIDEYKRLEDVTENNRGSIDDLLETFQLERTLQESSFFTNTHSCISDEE